MAIMCDPRLAAATQESHQQLLSPCQLQSSLKSNPCFIPRIFPLRILTIGKTLEAAQILGAVFALVMSAWASWKDSMNALTGFRSAGLEGPWRGIC